MPTTLTRPSVGAGPASATRRRGLVVLASTIVAVSLIVLGMALLFLRGVSRPVPSFASLAEHPDHALQGTVAYFADQSGCVRIVAAAGAPSKDVLCIPPQDVTKALELGKEVGPQLVWLPDGRLEVTMFRQTKKPGPGFNPGWQKIVDVRTGHVQNVPRAEVPSNPNLHTRPTMSPDGERIIMTSDPPSGRVKVVLAGGAGSRTVLSAQGPPSYTYGLYSAFWEPDWQWIAADDGRILIITTGNPPVTRVLTDESSRVAFGGEDPRIARFAVTDKNLLSPAR
jgi:hypothetical protein